MAEVNVTAMICLFYTGVYFSYLQRPLQTNFFLNAAAQKCLILLRYSTSSMTPEEYESLKRVFWCCFILESDIIVELEEIPQSGCSSMESQVPLRTRFDTHESRDTSELSTLYFLACISIRRLLNRIHTLLYSQESVARMHVVPDMNIISELFHQLEEWRTVLPSYLKFDLSSMGEPAANSYQGFLPQRYLAAKSVIFRPVFATNLRNGQLPVISDMVPHAEQCIEAVMMHMTNLRGFTHTVVIDTWICSLSMAGVALVLFIALKTPPLKIVLEENEN
ncbi:hypothetical protein V1520DRAFT_279515 [Lipomyces starkeyi]|uniref:Xylanolytic transcriptional activator regulatory domain-containing protein n=1 Tax=Lipomyces starkeyi NRRL Y-11557 TaxID=675824 RepID=A0A1E3PW24_LIPST|nr:hypothetical protein LIPSTDRAFT_192139 [Lipomyces starkeyi NRRL Y-11557]